MIHTKNKGALTVMSTKEEEVVFWCKEMVYMSHGMELIQLKLNVAQFFQSRPNPFRDGFPGKSCWESFKAIHPDLVL